MALSNYFLLHVLDIFAASDAKVHIENFNAKPWYCMASGNFFTCIIRSSNVFEKIRMSSMKFTAKFERSYFLLILPSILWMVGGDGKAGRSQVT